MAEVQIDAQRLELEQTKIANDHEYRMVMLQSSVEGSRTQTPAIRDRRQELTDAKGDLVAAQTAVALASLGQGEPQ